MHKEQAVNVPIVGQAERRKSTFAVLRQWLAVSALVYLLLVAVGRSSRGFTEVSGGAGGAERIFALRAIRQWASVSACWQPHRYDRRAWLPR